LARETVVQESEFFVATEIRTIASSKRGALTLISQASHFEKQWLEEVYPGSIRRSAEHRYDRSTKRVEVIDTERFADLVLGEARTKDFDPKASGRCLAEAWRDECLSLPLFDHRVQQLLMRCSLLRMHHPELGMKEIDDKAKLEIVARALEGERLAKEAQKKPLLPFFKESLSPEIREWLGMLYPESIEWVDGKTKKLVYQLPKKKTGSEHIEAILNVPLSECFKLEDHPTLGDGCFPITLILGGPKGKELARTTDWPKFRIQEYSALKNRWKQKFPSFIWP